MLKKEIACGPVYSIRVFQTGVCRIGGEYAYRHLDRDLDHAFTIYIAMIQGNGLTAIIDTGMASVDEMNRSDLLTYWLSIYPEIEESTDFWVCAASLRTPKNRASSNFRIGS